MSEFLKTIDAIRTKEEQWHTEKKPVWGLATDFDAFDIGLGGVHDGELSVLAARPGNGKTTLANQMAFNIANRFRKHHRQTGEHPGVVLIFSPEMSLWSIIVREACAISAVPSRALKTGSATVEQRDEFHAALDALSKLEGFIYINTRSDMRITDIETGVAQFDERAKFMVLDYLTLLSPDPNIRKQDWLQVGDWTRRLKTLAMQYSLPVMALSQLSRDVEKDAEGNEVDRPPKLSDLRRSGEIEQHADMVLLLSRQRERVSQGDRGVAAVLDIAKNRDGPTGYINMYFNTAYNQFTEAPLKSALHLEGV